MQMDKIVLRKIDEIPAGMLYDFSDETEEQTFTKVRRANTIFGAFFENKLVGFNAADAVKNSFQVCGFFVEKAFRGKGIGARLVNKIARVAKSMGYEEIYFVHMPSQMKRFLEKYKRGLDARRGPHKSPYRVDIVPEGIQEGFSGTIEFKKPKKMQRRK